MIVSSQIDSTFWKRFASIKGNPYLLSVQLVNLRCLFVHLVLESDGTSGDFPIAFGYMASLLRMNGAQADIRVMKTDSFLIEDFRNYDLVCFFPTVALISRLLRCISFVKRAFPEMKVCLFNSEQHQHEMILNSPAAEVVGRKLMARQEEIDFILLGECELALLKLCEKIGLKESSYEFVPGCLYRKGSTVLVSHVPGYPADFEFLPFPARDLLGSEVVSPRIQSSRGCTSRCLFCVESTSNKTAEGRKKVWVGRRVSTFVDEIELLYRRYNYVFFNVIDSSFEDPGKLGRERLRTFCDEIQKRNIRASFKIHLRVDSISQLDDEMISRLKIAGVDVIILGVESGVDRELKSYLKRASAYENLKNTLRMENYGQFFVLLGHMMFSPLLQFDELSAKINFLDQVGHAWDYMNLSNNLIVYEGTAYHRLLKEFDLVANDSYLGAVPYLYQDRRVGVLSHVLGALKIRVPEVILLNQRLYDCLNVMARFSNPVNAHLQGEKHVFSGFSGKVKNLLEKTSQLHVEKFNTLFNLVGEGASECDLERSLSEAFRPECKSLLVAAESALGDFFSYLEKNNLSTRSLYLETWMSVVNQKINSSSGKILELS